MLDLHLDTILQRRLFGYDARRRHRSWMRAQPLFGHADLPRMREAGYRGACLGVHGLPWESEGVWRELHRQLDEIDALGEEPGVRRVRVPQDWRLAREAGELALGAGVEGAHMLNGSVERVSELAERGVSYLTLAHLASNSACATSWGLRADDARGLSAYGEALVRALEAHDVLIDLAHVNHRGVMRACELATRPLLCTHIAFAGVHRHRRNMQDEALRAIAALDGVVGIIFGTVFLSGKLWVSSECIVDHVVYAAERVGVRHVALGSDFDGWLVTIPNDMRDCLGVVTLRERLLARGFSAAEVEAICYGNAARVLER